jgi:hypothetical protein
MPPGKLWIEKESEGFNESVVPLKDTFQRYKREL